MSRPTQAGPMTSPRAGAPTSLRAPLSTSTRYLFRESGVGSSANEVYKTDGSRIPNGLHPFEDRSFRFKKEEYGLCLYGVFDGFSGGQVADFVMKRLPAELLLGQLVPDLPPEMVREQLKQAFVSVDREHFGIIGDRLAARMVMRGEEDRPGRASQLAGSTLDYFPNAISIATCKSEIKR